ncbi:GNAT family N-acetyltransferase [candidate division GN15 bacterium]|nr:GNAT family N-acetyltransferase [candidate division GN15 bacterium]
MGTKSVIRVETALPQDAAAIKDLFRVTIVDTFRREGIADTHPEDIEREIDTQVALLDRCIGGMVDDSTLLVARVPGDAGFVSAGTIACSSPHGILRQHLDLDDSLVREVRCAYVLPEFQGRGIGSRLFQEILSRLSYSEIGEFALDSGYSTAQAYWARKLGPPTKVLKDYWSVGADHMIWHHRVDEFV